MVYLLRSRCPNYFRRYGNPPQSSKLRMTTKSVRTRNENDRVEPVAAIGISSAKAIIGRDKLDDLNITPTHQKAFEEVEKHREPVHINNPEESFYPFAVVPIFRGDIFLGLIQADNDLDKTITDSELQIVASFALQIAVAISEAQSQKELELLKEQLDEASVLIRFYVAMRPGHTGLASAVCIASKRPPSASI